jgi:putative endonuclease
MTKIESGRQAEDAVVNHMRGRGLTIVGRNIRVGRLEIDIVARNTTTLIVCEVRSRGAGGIHPAWMFTRKKQEHVRRAALLYWSKHAPKLALRLDAAAVTLSSFGPRIQYFENVFSVDG